MKCFNYFQRFANDLRWKVIFYDCLCKDNKILLLQLHLYFNYINSVARNSGGRMADEILNILKFGYQNKMKEWNFDIIPRNEEEIKWREELWETMKRKSKEGKSCEKQLNIWSQQQSCSLTSRHNTEDQSRIILFDQ